MQQLRWNVGDEESALRGLSGKRGKAAAFDRGEVLAQRVHVGDAEAGVHEGAMEVGCLFDGDGFVDGKLHHRGGAAADQEEDEVVGAET